MSKQSYSELKHLKVCSNLCQLERSFRNFCHWPRPFLHDLSHEIFPVPTTPVGNINLVMLAFLLLPRYLSVFQLPFEDKCPYIPLFHGFSCSYVVPGWCFDLAVTCSSLPTWQPLLYSLLLHLIDFWTFFTFTFVQRDFLWKLAFAKVLCATAALPPFCSDSDE